MTIPTPRRGRWFRFSLRSLFVAVSVLGIWLGIQAKWMRDRLAAKDLRDEYEQDRVELSSGDVAPAGGLRVLGEPGYEQVLVFVRDYSHLKTEEKDLKRRIEAFFPEAKVEFALRMFNFDPGFGDDPISP